MSKYIADRISEGSTHQGAIVAAAAVAVALAVDRNLERYILH